MKDPKVLLIEDNIDDETLTLRALKKARLVNQIVVVRDGVEALDYLFCKGVYSSLTAEDMPQVILLDIKLPKIDGLEVLRKIRSEEKTALLPVILLTSSSEEKDLYEGYKCGANSYIVKPVDPAQFERCIMQLGLYWMVLNHGAAK